MKARGKIDIRQLKRLLERRLTQAEIAKRFGVSRSAVCQAVKRLQKHTPAPLGARQPHKTLRGKLNVWGCELCNWYARGGTGICIVQDNPTRLVEIERLPDCPRRNRQVLLDTLRNS